MFLQPVCLIDFKAKPLNEVRSIVTFFLIHFSMAEDSGKDKGKHLLSPPRIPVASAGMSFSPEGLSVLLIHPLGRVLTVPQTGCGFRQDSFPEILFPPL